MDVRAVTASSASTISETRVGNRSYPPQEQTSGSSLKPESEPVIFTENTQALMRTAHLRAVGGFVMLAIPENVLDRLQLRPNAKVGLTISEGKLVVDPDPKPFYTAEQLAAKCDLDAPLAWEDREWLGSPPLGREAI